jgi:hypothetical protein
MAGEIQLNSTTMATESSGSITLSNVNSATNRTNLGLGSIATQNANAVALTGGSVTGTEIDLKSSGTTIYKSDGTTAVLSESGGAVTFTADAAVIEGSSSGDLVRITQTGSGNALVVEDSSNPDSTPFIINANGEVYVGTTTGTINSSNFGTSIGASLKHSRNTATSAVVQFFGTAGECRILGDGDVLNTGGNSISSISDIKLKENIVDATPKLSDICNIRIVNFNLKKNPKKKLLGVIAQEVETIFPRIVSEIIDEDDEGNDLGTTTKYVKTSVFIFMLIKAIQEQQTLIESQQSQIDALIARIEALETT